MARHINETGLAMIKSFEGLRLDAYRDPVGIWTIGYGHTRGVQPGMTIPESQATDFLRQDLAAAENFIGAVTADVPTLGNQFSAMVSLCFNIGSGNFKSSSVLRFRPKSCRGRRCLPALGQRSCRRAAGGAARAAAAARGGKGAVPDAGPVIL